MDRRRLSGELQRAHCEPDRMAGKGRWPTAARGPGDRPGIARSGTQCRTHLELSGWAEVPRGHRGSLATFLKFALLVLALVAASVSFAAERIVSSRVWPAQEYTRVTLESAQPVRHQFFFVSNPVRLVVDLEGVELNDELKGLPAKVGANDPYIQAVRVGVNRPNVVRVVFDLRTEVKPSVFPLAPVGEYKHRLVLDIYPAKPADPLLALLAPKTDPIGEIASAPMTPVSAEEPKAEASVLSPPLPVLRLDPGKLREVPPRVAAKPKTDRLVIIAVDAGHGGEDSGARGRHGTREKDVTLAIARLLKTRIDQEPNMRSVLVRDGDYFVPLRERVNKSQRVRADLFVSIHADAWVRPDARGSSVFALSERGATSTAARILA